MDLELETKSSYETLSLDSLSSQTGDGQESDEADMNLFLERAASSYCPASCISSPTMSTTSSSLSGGHFYTQTFAPNVQSSAPFYGSSAPIFYNQPNVWCTPKEEPISPVFEYPAKSSQPMQRFDLPLTIKSEDPEGDDESNDSIASSEYTLAQSNSTGQLSIDLSSNAGQISSTTNDDQAYLPKKRLRRVYSKRQYSRRNKNAANPERKRDMANQQERNRMHKINAALQLLRSVLPVSAIPPSKRISKIKILRSAIAYIKFLSHELIELQVNGNDSADCDNLMFFSKSNNYCFNRQP